MKIFEKGRGMSEDYHHDDVVKPKSEKPWLGYYDFLITEGSYKFWVVFQVSKIIFSFFSFVSTLSALLIFLFSSSSCSPSVYSYIRHLLPFITPNTRLTIMKITMIIYWEEVPGRNVTFHHLKLNF